MAEFTILPFSAKDRFKDNAWHELRTALRARNELASNLIYNFDVLWDNDYPSEITIKSPCKLIQEYRDAVDSLTGFFVRESKILAGSRGYYNANLLHTAAFGQSAWRGSLSGTPHKFLWNDIKACLDLLKWVVVAGTFMPYSPGATTLAWSTNGILHYDAGINTWNQARSDAFTQQNNPLAPSFSFGRAGTAKYDDSDDEWDINIASIIRSYGEAPIIDWSGLTNTPIINDSYYRLYANYLDNKNHYTLMPTVGILDASNIVVTETKNVDVNGSGTFEGVSFQWLASELSRINITGGINKPGLALFPIADFPNIDPGIDEWPEPGGINETWIQALSYCLLDWFLKLSWDEIPSASPSATPSVSPSAS